jgi:succinate dehydrogenase / fumarate reductase flavoprotein subunit
VLGEANFSDHGANRLGASALMQGLADGYFVIPYTIGDYLARAGYNNPGTDGAEFKQVEKEVDERTKKLLSIGGKRSPDTFHRALGKIMWEHCGMGRNEVGLKKALEKIPALREEFWQDLKILGNDTELNQVLEQAGRVADFLEFAEVMCEDALQRDESCGAHFREEHQTEEGEALRDDENFTHVSAWEFKGVGSRPEMHKEELEFENVQLTQRSYK